MEICVVPSVLGGWSFPCTLRILTFPLPGPGPSTASCWPETKLSEQDHTSLTSKRRK